MEAWGKTPGPNEATWTWNLEQGPVGSSQVQRCPGLSTDENCSDGSLAGPKAEFPAQDVGRFPKGQNLGSAWEIFSGNMATCPGGREAVRHMQLQTGKPLPLSGAEREFIGCLQSLRAGSRPHLHAQRAQDTPQAVLGSQSMLVCRGQEATTLPARGLPSTLGGGGASPGSPASPELQESRGPLRRSGCSSLPLPASCAEARGKASEWGTSGGAGLQKACMATAGRPSWGGFVAPGPGRWTVVVCSWPKGPYPCGRRANRLSRSRALGGHRPALLDSGRGRDRGLPRGGPLGCGFTGEEVCVLPAGANSALSVDSGVPGPGP